MEAIEKVKGIPICDQQLFIDGDFLDYSVSLRFQDKKDQDCLNLVFTQPFRHHRDAVPPGTFDEPKMVAELKLRATTIRKAIIKINSLYASSGGNLQGASGIFHWMEKKAKHASEIIRTVSEFCLCQRVKLIAFDDKDFYLAALHAHHNVMHAATEAKKSAVLSTADKLDKALGLMLIMYVPCQENLVRTETPGACRTYSLLP
jgi:large subunit ribosomal protein L40e/small subunit ribosomal protein S27Ae/ubiquitin C